MSGYTTGTQDYLGRDEQRPEMLFLRLVSPSELQQAAWAMNDLIRRAYIWDFVNSKVWSLIGWDMDSKTTPWLREMVSAGQKSKKTLTSDNKAWMVSISNTLGHDNWHSTEYVKYYLKAKAGGQVSRNIWEPFSYVEEASGPVADAARASAQVLSDSAKTLIVPIVAIVAAYGLVTVAMPKLVAQKAQRTARKATA